MQSQEESCLVKLGKDENIEIKPKLGSVFSPILLTPDGYIEGDTFHSWHDIEQFGLTTKYYSLLFSKKIVFWNYRHSSSSRQWTQKLSRLLSGYDEGLESDNYEVEPEELVKLLNDWRNRYTGLTSEIIIGTRLDKQISMTVYFFGIALAIAVIVMLALFTNVFK